MLLTDTRKPLDNLISGAVFAAVTTAGISVANKNANAKKIAKIALQSGVASSLAISAANNVANKNYSNALICGVLGFAGVALIESLFNEKEKYE